MHDYIIAIIHCNLDIKLDLPEAQRDMVSNL